MRAGAKRAAPEVAVRRARRPDLARVIEIDAAVTRLPKPDYWRSLFRRYAAMRHWSEDQALPFERFVTPDGLHMNDWGYACFARLLADNMASAVNRSRAVADVKPQIQ